MKLLRWHKATTMAGLACLISQGNLLAEGYSSSANPMLLGLGDWTTESIFTVGETIGDYQPPGILDGLAAFPLDEQTTRVLANHELVNGTLLTGARITFFDLHASTRELCGAGLAYHSIYDRSGQLVTSATQINEGNDPLAGLNRLCSAAGYEPGQYGFEDFLFFTGEETGNGTEWVLDAVSETLWAAPQLGRGAWENVTALETGHEDKVALLLGDDTAGAPLYLYVGQKNAWGDGSFLDRSSVYPEDATDPFPDDIGNWESSGILDVTHLFDTAPGEVLLLLDAQAHSVRDGSIFENGLAEGGQLLFLGIAP